MKMNVMFMLTLLMILFVVISYLCKLGCYYKVYKYAKLVGEKIRKDKRSKPVKKKVLKINLQILYFITSETFSNFLGKCSRGYIRVHHAPSHINYSFDFQ